MAKKKNFISLKRGLSEDPKHRERMGNRIWLFLHILDKTDWETGIAFDWRDKDEASDMCIAHRTLQKQRQELEDLGYISCKKKRDKQEIIVYNWINPRNYSGEIINPKSTQNSVVLENKSTQQSTQSSYADLGTHTLDSKIKDQNTRRRDPLLDNPAVTAFKEITHRTPNEIQRLDISKSVNGNLEDWRRAVEHWCGHGWNKTNVTGMLSFLNSGGVTACSQCNRNSPSRIGAPLQGATLESLGITNR